MTIKQMNDRINAMLLAHPEWKDLDVCLWNDEFQKWEGTDPVEDVNILKYKPEGGVFLAIGLKPWPSDDEYEVLWPKEDR